MQDVQDRPDTAAIEDLRQRLAGLDTSGEVRAGHLDLAPGIWFSADPAGRAQLSLRPADAGGFTLGLEQGDSGAWACLGMRLPPAALAATRYLGLLVELRGGDTCAFRPVLRYWLGEGMRDVSAAAPVVLPGGAGVRLAYIPTDPELAAAARDCELNLFFLSNHFEAEVARLEPLLML